MQERRSSSLCVDWMDAKGKKDIIDNMHEHKSISTNFGATTSEHHYFIKFWQWFWDLADISKVAVLIRARLSAMQHQPYICRSNPRCPCQIEVPKGIRNLGEKQNQFTGTMFNYCTSLQRVIFQVSLPRWSLKVYQEPRGENEIRPQVLNSNAVPFLKEFFFRCLPECFAGQL